MDKRFDVIGVGNVLVDVLIQTEENKINEFGLQKGVFNPLSQEKLNEINKKISDLNPKTTPAGSCPNTIMGIASLGGKCSLIGKIGADVEGDFYLNFLRKLGVEPNLSKTEKAGTGKCICLITPDAQRTLAADLGAANYLEATDILEGSVKNSRHLHLTAYELERSNVRDASLHAMEMAKQGKSTISIDLADPETIRRHRKVIEDSVKKYADIIFANESEAMVFTGKQNTEDALDELSKYADTVVLKIGKDGSLIKHFEKTYQIPVYPVNAVDTTGAGDLYASGFLWAYTQNKPLETCGKIGSFVASRIVSQVGAIIEANLIDDVEKIK